ncbi:MAG: glycosyltransferase [Planctomycetes bacterium]|nr:glycosyltransferase [Planctomycetota bacterium]
MAGAGDPAAAAAASPRESSSPRDPALAPLVAHLIRTWIAPSETFIEGQVLGNVRTRSLVVARHERQCGHENDSARNGAGARERLAGRPLLLTTDGLGAVAHAVADLAYRARVLTECEGANAAARIREHGVALLHAHFGTDAAFFRPLWSRLDLPRVASFYGYDAWKTGQRFMGLGARYLRRVFESFDALIVPSRDMANDLSALGAQATKVRVLPWGIDLTRFRPRAIAAAHSGANSSDAFDESNVPVGSERPSIRRSRIVTVCRFIAKKGLHDAIAAFARSCRVGVDAEFHLVGDGPLRSSLEQQAHAEGVADRVRFAGFVPAAQLPELLRSCDLFLHPSVTPPDGDKEGVPTTILEAAASGLPVIATHHGGIREAVADGVSGCLVAEHDVAALAQRLIELARDPQRRRAMGAAGRALIAERFDFARQNARREELYFELLARGGPRAATEPR